MERVGFNCLVSVGGKGSVYSLDKVGLKKGLLSIFWIYKHILE